VREEKRIISLDPYEEGAVIQGLNMIRTEQIESDNCPEFVSDLMLKIMQAPTKKVRIRNDPR